MKPKIKADLPVYKQEKKIPKFGKNVSLHMCFSSHLWTTIRHIFYPPERSVLQKAGHHPVPVLQRYAGS